MHAQRYTLKGTRTKRKNLKGWGSLCIIKRGKKKMKAYLCALCLRIYTPNRPRICECKSNVFLEEYDTTPEELEELKKKGATIIKNG